MISEAANEGQEITRKQVRRLTDEFTAATSPLSLRKFVSAPRRTCFHRRLCASGPRAGEIAEPQQDDLRKVLRDEPELDRIKDVTHTARWITKATESGEACVPSSRVSSIWKKPCRKRSV